MGIWRVNVSWKLMMESVRCSPSGRSLFLMISIMWALLLDEDVVATCRDMTLDYLGNLA